MLLGIAIALILLWLVIRVFFKVTKWAVHLALLAGVVVLALHFLRTK